MTLQFTVNAKTQGKKGRPVDEVEVSSVSSFDYDSILLVFTTVLRSARSSYRRKERRKSMIHRDTIAPDRACYRRYLRSPRPFRSVDKGNIDPLGRGNRKGEKVRRRGGVRGSGARKKARGERPKVETFLFPWK